MPFWLVPSYVLQLAESATFGFHLPLEGPPPFTWGFRGFYCSCIRPSVFTRRNRPGCNSKNTDRCASSEQYLCFVHLPTWRIINTEAINFVSDHIIESIIFLQFLFRLSELVVCLVEIKVICSLRSLNAVGTGTCFWSTTFEYSDWIVLPYCSLVLRFNKLGNSC